MKILQSFIFMSTREIKIYKKKMKIKINVVVPELEKLVVLLFNSVSKVQTNKDK